MQLLTGKSYKRFTEVIFIRNCKSFKLLVPSPLITNVKIRVDLDLLIQVEILETQQRKRSDSGRTLKTGYQEKRSNIWP